MVFHFKNYVNHFEKIIHIYVKHITCNVHGFKIFMKGFFFNDARYVPLDLWYMHMKHHTNCLDSQTYTYINKNKLATINIAIFSQHQLINITEWEAQLLLLCVSQWGASFWAGRILIGLWLWLTGPFESSQEPFTLTSRNCYFWAWENNEQE